MDNRTQAVLNPGLVQKVATTLYDVAAATPRGNRWVRERYVGPSFIRQWATGTARTIVGGISMHEGRLIYGNSNYADMKREFAQVKANAAYLQKNLQGYTDLSPFEHSHYTVVLEIIKRNSSWRDLIGVRP